MASYRGLFIGKPFYWQQAFRLLPDADKLPKWWFHSENPCSNEAKNGSCRTNTAGISAAAPKTRRLTGASGGLRAEPGVGLSGEIIVGGEW